MQLIKDAANRVQDLMGLALGNDSTYADYDYIIKFLAIRSDDLNLRFQSLGLNFDTQVVTLIGVPANTTDLSLYQATGGALDDLFMPDSGDGSSPIEWRLTGQSDLAWQPVAPVGKVVDTNSSTNGAAVESISPVVQSYEWRGGVIFISPCSQIVDLRVRGDFLPSLTDEDAAPFIKGMKNVLCYWTCDMICTYGPGAEAGGVAKAFKEDSLRAEADFICTLAKAQLTVPVRLGGRRTRFPGPIGQGMFVPPIVG